MTIAHISVCVCVCVCVCVLSLSDLVLESCWPKKKKNELGSIPASLVFWKGLGRIAIQSSLNVYGIHL